MQSWEEIPPDGKIFTFEYKAQAREWYHRREWERMWFGNPREQLRMTGEEKEWVDFHNEMRERVDAKKGEIERLLQSDIMKNVTHGLDLHGFKVTESREIFKEGTGEPFCGLGGALAEGLDRATLMIAMFELYLDYAHAQEAKRHLKEVHREEEARRLDSRDLER